MRSPHPLPVLPAGSSITKFRFRLVPRAVAGALVFGTLAGATATARAQAPAALAPGAATNGEAAYVLTFDEALALARRNNRDLSVGRARLEQSSASVRQAWTTLFPTVVLQGKYTHNNREVALAVPVGPAMNGMPAPTRDVVIQRQEQLDGAATATVPLLVPWAYPALRAARFNEEAAEATFVASEMNVLLATAQSYFALSGADEVLRARRSAVVVAQRTLDNANARLQAGTATKVDAARASLALLRAEQGVREAELAYEQAERGLRTLVQLRRPFKIGDVPRAAAPPPAEGIFERALQLRPEFRAADLGIKSAAAQARASTLRWAPSISAFGNGRIFNYAGFSGDRYAWAVGAQLDWALFDAGARDAQRRLALAQRRENEARLEQLRDVVGDELANDRSLLEVKFSAEKTAVQSVELARQTLDLVRSQYEAGTATQLDLLQAQDAVVGAEVGLAQAHVEVGLADLSLRRAAGLFPPR